MKVLIKLGGTLLDQAAKLAAIAAQLASLAHHHQLVVVHGGGKQVTRFLEDQGIQSEFVNGLRVSNRQVVDAITKVIAGSLNKSLVAALIAEHARAVGLSGIDGALTEAEPLDPQLEFVGRPVASDGRLLQLLLNAGYLPVVACLAGDRQGNLYNVNADQMAVSCATGWRAERLIFLTDVPGVKDSSGEIIPHLNAEAVASLIASGVATGGMQAKLEAAMAAVAAGQHVTIALGSAPDICRRLLSGESPGTEFNPEPVASGGRR